MLLRNTVLFSTKLVEVALIAPPLNALLSILIIITKCFTFKRRLIILEICSL